MAIILPKDCSFCLKPEQKSDIPERTVYETDNFRVFPTMGQITDGGYVLIVPKGHFSCIGVFPPELMDEFVAVKDEMARRVSATYQHPEFFEHGIVGQTVQHAHLHVIPTNTHGAPIAQYERDGLERIALDSVRDLAQVLTKRGVYLFSETEAGPFAFTTKVIPMYVRDVYAKILGVPDRANWRTMDRTLDDKLIAETVGKLKLWDV